MKRSRTLPALAAMTLMTAVVASAGTTGARAEDFQAQGSHLNDPANLRTPNDQQDPKTSRLTDPANPRNVGDQQDPKTSRLKDAAEQRDPAVNAHSADDKANKREVK
jgi:hypothetical protein